MTEFASASEVVFWLPIFSYAQLLCKLICILAPQKSADLMEQVMEKQQDKVIFLASSVWKWFQLTCENALIYLFLAAYQRHQRWKSYAGSNTDFVCLPMKDFSQSHLLNIINL